MSSAKQHSIELESVPHPGENVQEYLEFFGWSQSELARRTGLTPKTISEICNGKSPISPPTALAFERVLQRPAHFWLALQRQFDELEARKREEAKAPSWEAWVNRFPITEMKNMRFSLPQGRTDADSLLQFFGVSSPESWNSVWTSAEVAYRQTRSMNFKEEAVAVWVRETELVARQLQLADFNEQELLKLIPRLRSLTRTRAEEIMDPVQQICAAAGVAVVWVPSLKSTGISGCARWLSDRKALVGLTLRYKTDDQMWFTLFHELGHILLHRRRRSFVLDNAAEDLGDQIVDPEMQQVEAEANRFSADVMIPPHILGEFTRKRVFTNESIHNFAEAIDIAPGIVVGRLQHDGFIERHQGNALKQKLDWNFIEEG
jgi:HTH-type transcriptional regulator/antitoxin HigA